MILRIALINSQASLLKGLSRHDQVCEGKLSTGLLTRCLHESAIQSTEASLAPLRFPDGDVQIKSDLLVVARTCYHVGSVGSGCSGLPHCGRQLHCHIVPYCQRIYIYIY